MSEEKYICESCGKEYNSNEYEITNDEKKCILHCSKEYWTSDTSSKKMKYFWNIISMDINHINASYKNHTDINRQMVNEYDFEMYKYEYKKVIFPKFGEHFISFNIAPFEGLNSNINLNFNNCTFSNDVSFDLIHKAKNISFQSCIFQKSVIFNNVTFDNNFIFEECILLGDISFRNIVFNSLVSFIKTTSKNKLKFVHTRFNDSCLLNMIKVDELIIDNTYFRKEANFLNITVRDLNRETARIIKNSFEQQNNIIEANKFYALEMKKYDDEINWKENFKEKLVFKFHEWSSDHSQNWLLPLFWILLFSMILGVFQNKFLDICVTNAYETYSTNVGYFFILISSGFFLDNILFNKEIKKYLISSMLLVIGFYLLITKDLFLELSAKAINPFSVMRDFDNINGLELIFKIVISYLIYQLIVSIRQNTRRK